MHLMLPQWITEVQAADVDHVSSASSFICTTVNTNRALTAGSIVQAVKLTMMDCLPAASW